MNALRVCLAVILALALSYVLCSAQGCKTWAQALAKSFFPHQVDEPSLRTFSNLSAQEYLKAISQVEEKDVAEQLAQGVAFQHDVSFGNVQSQLNTALGQFYQVGSQLYGVDLSPENLAVAPTGDINAFATGSHVFVNAGLIQYFLQPADYVGAMVKAETGELTSEHTKQFERILRGETIGTACTTSSHTRHRTT